MCTPHSGLYRLPIGPCLSPSASSPPELRTPGCQNSSYQGAGVAAGFLPRAFLQEPLSLPCCHRSLADGPQEPSKEALGPQSVPNLLPLGRSLAGGARAAVGWARRGPLAPLVATGQRGPQWLLSHLDVSKNPGRKCFLKTQGEEKERQVTSAWTAHRAHSFPYPLWEVVTGTGPLLWLPPMR